jgi:cathepsin B
LKGHPNYVQLPQETPAPVPTLPVDFDWRAQRPDCASIALVRDQSACGSCWAFGSTETFNDRRCIHLNDTLIYSTDDTTACCSSLTCGFSAGCNGGQPGAALDWMSQTGVVTGGLYTDIGKGTTCLPYALAPCAHHVPPTPKYPACPSADYPTPKCAKKCTETTYPKPYATDKTKGKGGYSVSGVQNIMADLYTNGPLSIAITVYSDFLTYKSGVYHHVTGEELGGHAVELVGWGVENGVNYWLVKNSWNEQWGAGGFIKMQRGIDECGIEDDVSGVHV